MAAGCTSEGGQGDAKPSPSPTTTDIDLPSEHDPRVDNSAQYDERFLERPDVLAPGHGLRPVAKLDPQLPDGSRWSPVTATPAGKIVGSVYSRSDRSVHGVVLIDPMTGEQTTLARGQQWSMFAADANERWVVWITAGGRDLFTFPWRLWAYDRRTGETKMIAEAPDVGTKPVPTAPDGTTPTLHGDTVFLSAVADVSKRGKVEPAIFRVRADGSKPMRKIIDHAYRPQVTEDTLYYTVGTGGSFRTWDIRERNLETTTDDLSVLSARNGPRNAGTAVGGGAIRWQQQSSGRCVSYLAESGESTRLLSARCGRYFQGDSQGTDRYLSFAFERSARYLPYVYDLEYERLARLGNDMASNSPVGHGNLLVWEPLTGPDKGKVVVARLTDKPPLPAKRNKG